MNSYGFVWFISDFVSSDVDLIFFPSQILSWDPLPFCCPKLHRRFIRFKATRASWPKTTTRLTRRPTGAATGPLQRRRSSSARRRRTNRTFTTWSGERAETEAVPSTLTLLNTARWERFCCHFYSLCLIWSVVDWNKWIKNVRRWLMTF